MDKETFLKIIESYLESSYNTAFMINGSWGSGKTYFWKKEIQKHIEGELSKKRDKPYKVIYIPLYGSTSIQDIKSKLVSELYILNLKENYVFYKQDKKESNNKNENDDNQTSILNLVTSFIITNESDSLFKKINLQNFDKYEYVLCFDDLERLEENLINECLGFINFLMEHSNIKTFIIANEEEIISIDENKDEQKKDNEKVSNLDYIKNKEKTISQYFNFNNLEKRNIFDIILKKLASQSINFNKILKDKKFNDKFFNLFETKINFNFRTLFHFLYLLNLVDKINIEKIDETKKDLLLEQLIIYTISISFLSKKDIFSKISPGDIPYLTEEMYFSLLLSKKEEDKKSDLDKIVLDLKNYINILKSENIKEYVLFKSIFYLIKDGYLNIDLLNKELYSKFGDKSVLINYINKMFNYETLSYEKFREYYSNSLRSIENGELDTLRDYFKIGQRLLYFIEIKLLETSEFNNIKDAISMALNTSLDIKKLREFNKDDNDYYFLKTSFGIEDFTDPITLDYFKNQLLEIINDFGRKINSKIKDDDKKRLLDLSEENIYNFLSEIYLNYKNQDILNDLGMDFINIFLKRSNNYDLSLLYQVIENRYQNEKILSKEKDTLNLFVTEIDNYLSLSTEEEIDKIKILNLRKINEIILRYLDLIKQKEQSNEKNN